MKLKLMFMHAFFLNKQIVQLTHWFTKKKSIQGRQLFLTDCPAQTGRNQNRGMCGACVCGPVPKNSQWKRAGLCYSINGKILVLTKQWNVLSEYTLRINNLNKDSMHHLYKKNHMKAQMCYIYKCFWYCANENRMWELIPSTICLYKYELKVYTCISIANHQYFELQNVMLHYQDWQPFVCQNYLLSL